MGPRYTNEENEILKTDKTDAELAEILHRSIKGIRQQRRKLLGKSKNYQRYIQLDTTASTWNLSTVNQYKERLKIGDVVTVRTIHYGTSESERTWEEKAVVMKKYPDVCVTDRGSFQYKELIKWETGSDFV